MYCFDELARFLVLRGRSGDPAILSIEAYCLMCFYCFDQRAMHCFDVYVLL